MRVFSLPRDRDLRPRIHDERQRHARLFIRRTLAQVDFHVRSTALLVVLLDTRAQVERQARRQRTPRPRREVELRIDRRNPAFELDAWRDRVARPLLQAKHDARPGARCIEFDGCSADPRVEVPLRRRMSLQRARGISDLALHVPARNARALESSQVDRPQRVARAQPSTALDRRRQQSRTRTFAYREHRCSAARRRLRKLVFDRAAREAERAIVLDERVGRVVDRRARLRPLGKIREVGRHDALEVERREAPRALETHVDRRGAERHARA